MRILQYSIAFIAFSSGIMSIQTFFPSVDYVEDNARPNVIKVFPTMKFDTTIWEELTEEDGFVLDIKYATRTNFTETIIYDCPKCFVHKELAKILKKLNANIQEQGFCLKLFDCYRPKSAQEKLWAIVPDHNYVSPPEKGSMHNRGLAVDLTLLDSLGVELDMGTAYDYFGKEAHVDYIDLSPAIRKNRILLFSNIKRVGLSGIKTEWWHFSLKNVGNEVSDWEWVCD